MPDQRRPSGPDRRRLLRDFLANRRQKYPGELAQWWTDTGGGDWRELQALMGAAPTHAGIWGPPVYAAEFLARYARAKSASSILDPFCMWPTLAAGVATEAGIPATALTPVPEAAELGKVVAPTVDWVQPSDPLGFPEVEGTWDFIFCAPPLGMKARAAASYGVRQGVGEVAHELLLRSVESLSPEGSLAFLIADGFFVRRDARRTQDRLAEAGFRVEAAISVEGALRPQSDVSASLVFVGRGQPQEEIFVGQVDHAVDQETLLRNMLKRQNGPALQLGWLVMRQRYKGWRALVSARDAFEEISHSRFPILELGEIIEAILRLPNEADETRGNSMYVPDFISSSVQTTPPVEGKERGWFQVALDPEKANAAYVSAWLNGPLGRTARRSLSTGSMIERIRVTDIGELLIGLPPLEEQEKAVAVAQEMTLLASELNDSVSRIWRGSVPIDEAARAATRVADALRSEPTKLALTTDEWIEALPFPLAVIGRTYRNVVPVGDKVDRLQYFFEATGVVLVTILLSAAKREVALYEKTVEKLRNAGASHRGVPVLDRTDFHTWINVGRTVSKRVRSRIEHDKSDEAVGALFGSLDAEFVDRLLREEIWDAIDAARTVRNDRSHGGIENNKWRRQQLARLETALSEFRTAAGDLFIGVEMIRPGACEQDETDLFVFDRAERLMGSNPMFAERQVIATGSMRARRLHLVPADGVAKSPLELLPLVTLQQFPDTEERAVYYYNRRIPDGGGFRFVSYYFEGRPEEVVTDPALDSLLADITPDD